MDKMTTMPVDYEQFLQSKRLTVLSTGREIELGDTHPILFPFQREVIRWAAKQQLAE